MGLVDSIIGAESGGNPNAQSGEVVSPPYIFAKLWIIGIVKLLFVSCPSAVSRLVAELWINAVNGVFWRRLWSHIRKEAFKTTPPSVANVNALGPVVFVADVSRSRASLLHRTPSAILRSILQPVCFHRGADCFFLKAATTLRPLGSKAVLSHNGDVAAVACAAIAADSPRPAVVTMPLRFNFTINDKSSKSLAGKVYHVS